MPSVTLPESAKLAQSQLVAGIIESIVTVNRMFQVLPFVGIDGNSLAYNREQALGSAGVAGVGDDITADVVDPITGTVGGKDPATFERVNANLTTILGDAEVNGLVQATRSGDGNDQKAVQIASKAKKVGRVFQHMLINGTGAGNQFDGLGNLCPVSQKVDTGVNGTPFKLDIFDDLINLIKDKDGQVDYFAMNGRTINSYFRALRALGGASITETVQLPSGDSVPGYRGVPIFRNDYIAIDQTKGSQADTTTIFSGTLDDGSMQHGISGLTADRMSGIQVVEVGELESRDESLTRVKWYSGLALFSELGLACAEGIHD